MEIGGPNDRFEIGIGRHTITDYELDGRDSRQSRFTKKVETTKGTQICNLFLVYFTFNNKIVPHYHHIVPNKRFSSTILLVETATVVHRMVM